MRAYSLGLRERGVAERAAGLSTAEVARKYRVSPAWIAIAVFLVCDLGVLGALIGVSLARQPGSSDHLVESNRSPSKIAACRPFLAENARPFSHISVSVIPAQKQNLCIRVYNRTPYTMYRPQYALLVEQHIRANLWRQSLYRPYTEGDTDILCSGILLQDAEESQDFPCFSISTLPNSFFDGYLPFPNPLSPRRTSLQPGRYRVCVRFWQREALRQEGGKIVGPWQKRCSPPFRLPPRL